MKSLGEELAKATDILKTRGEKAGPAIGVAFLAERCTDKGLRSFSCACTLVAIELCCDSCLGERKHSLTDLAMGVATIMAIDHDASSWRSYHKQNQWFEGSVGAGAQALENAQPDAY